MNEQNAENRETTNEREQTRTEIFTIITDKLSKKSAAQYAIYDYLLIYCYSNDIDIKIFKKKSVAIKTAAEKIIEILNQLTNEQLFNFISDIFNLDFDIFKRLSNNAKSQV